MLDMICLQFRITWCSLLYQQCLNTMFKQVATEPWMANWQRLRSQRYMLLEHLEILNCNTLYLNAYIYLKWFAFFITVHLPLVYAQY